MMVQKSGDHQLRLVGKNPNISLRVLYVAGGLAVWGPVLRIPGIPENERDCYLEVPRFESQSTNPNHQLTICWVNIKQNKNAELNELISNTNQTKIRSGNFHSTLRYPFTFSLQQPPPKKKKTPPALVPCWALAIGLHHPVPRDLGPNPSNLGHVPPLQGNIITHLKGKKENYLILSHDRYCWRNPAITSYYGSLSYYLQGFIHPRWFSRRISEPSTVRGICDQQPRKSQRSRWDLRSKSTPLSQVHSDLNQGFGWDSRSQKFVSCHPGDEPASWGLHQVGIVDPKGYLSKIYLLVMRCNPYHPQRERELRSRLLVQHVAKNSVEIQHDYINGKKHMFYWYVRGKMGLYLPFFVEESKSVRKMFTRWFKMAWRCFEVVKTMKKTIQKLSPCEQWGNDF